MSGRGAAAGSAERAKDQAVIKDMVQSLIRRRRVRGDEISRMDLDDAGASPQRIAEAIIAQIPDLPVPVPVEEIACALDIVEIRVEPLKSFEGALITTGPEKGEGSIVVNAENRRRRRRYTIGHELGHFLHPQHLPPVGGSYCAADDMSRSSSAGMNKSALQEVQANVFAAELLLPRKCFLRDLRGKSGLDQRWAPRFRR